MRSPVPALVAAFVIALGALPRAADDLVTSRFGDYLESLRLQIHIPGLAAVIVGPNDITWERGFGQQNVERALPAMPYSPFETDGLMQMFTSVEVLHCVQLGRLALDDPIGRYSPLAPEPNATLRQLL